MHVRLVADFQEFLALEPAWRRLEQTGAVRNVFTTFDWLRCYWEVFGKGKQLHIVLLGEDQEIRAAAPLMISRAVARSLRRLELIGAGIYDFSDFIISPNDSDSAATALWSDIVKQSKQWDSMRLLQLPEHSPALHSLGVGDETMNGGGFSIRQTEGEACPSLVLPSSWDDYLPMLGKNMRYDLKRYSKRLYADFASVEFKLVRSHDEFDYALDALFKLHAARWRKRGLPGVLATPKRRRFQRELSHALLEKDRLRMFLLELDGTPAAALLNYYFNGKYCFYIGGFDPERDRYRPGTLLFAHAIRHAIEEGAKEFDFLRGQEEYKYRLGAKDTNYCNLEINKKTLRSRASAVYSRGEERILEGARRLARARYRK